MNHSPEPQDWQEADTQDEQDLEPTPEIQRSSGGSDEALAFLRSQTRKNTGSTTDPKSLPSTSDEPKILVPQEAGSEVSSLKQKWGLRPKVVLTAIALASVPIIAVGMGATLWVSQGRQQAEESGSQAAVLKQLENQLPLWFGAGAIFSGALAAGLAHRGIRPVIKAAEQSNTVINRLEREPVSLRDRVDGQDELVALEENLDRLGYQLIHLMGSNEVELEKFRVLMTITQKMRDCLTQDDVFRVAVEEIRLAYRADRVAIYRLNSQTDGTIVEESVGTGLPKMLWTDLEDPCLVDYLEKYRQGRISAIDDIYNAGLDDCHVGLLARFGIKANLVAPIIKNQNLFGFLIINQCHYPRSWQPIEIELVAQVATQIGLASDFVQLLEQTSYQTDQNEILIEILGKIRASLNEDHVLQTTVTEWRKILRAERVIIYGFDEQWYGTVLAEAAVPSVLKSLHATIYDPCFAEGYVEQYRKGRVRVIDNVSKAGLTECHLKQLEPYQVKANLVAPILKDNQLYGLLIAHACLEPRTWKAWEIDLHRQIAIQVGYALEHARVLQRLDNDMNQMQQLISLSKTIQRSLEEPEILKTTVDQVRKVLQTDRVMVYRFDENWYGTVTAESVVPGYPKALWAEIHDPCFAQGFVSKYQQGRVQAVNNVYEAGLTECHLQQLEPFEVKANLVAPILKDKQLFGLLIAHECEAPRVWHPEEIALMRQISLQVGLALDHAQLLSQVEQAYQKAHSSSQSERAQHEALQEQLEAWLTEGKTAAYNLEAAAVKQLDCATQVYRDLKANANASHQAQDLVETANHQYQQLSTLTQEIQGQINHTISNLEALHQTHRLLSGNTQSQETVSQDLIQHLDTIKEITSQLKLQSMNSALEAARMGPSGQEFVKIGESVLTLTRQLDSELAKIQPRVNQWHVEEQSRSTTVIDNQQSLEEGVQILHQLQEHSDRLQVEQEALEASVQSLTEFMSQHTQDMTQVSKTFLTLTEHVQQTSEQSLTLAKIVSTWHPSLTSSREE